MSDRSIDDDAFLRNLDYDALLSLGRSVAEHVEHDDFNGGPIGVCGECGHPLQIVRPGKYTCPYCDLVAYVEEHCGRCDECKYWKRYAPDRTGGMCRRLDEWGSGLYVHTGHEGLDAIETESNFGCRRFEHRKPIWERKMDES